MSEWYRRENVFAVAVALVRFAVCCYRAVHQSVIVDEATTYLKFVSGPWLKLFGRYDANNHILSSFLIKIMVTLGGLSPLTLRLPSLLGGLCLTLGIFGLLKRVESPVFRWTTYVLLCLYPMMLDFSIAARGYGISLAFFVWGLYFCLERRYRLAGCLLGLSIGANLAILFPVLALIGILVLFERRAKALLNLMVPTFLIAALIAGHSLRKAHREDFYAGYTQLRAAFTSFVITSLFPRPDRNGILSRSATETAAVFVVPLSMLLSAAMVFWFSGNRRQLIPIFTTWLTFVGMVLANRLFGLHYPPDRACMFFVILAAISWAIAGDAIGNRFGQALWLLPVLVLIVQFSLQLQFRYFEFWESEKDSGHIAGLIQAAALGKPDNSMALSVSWPQQPTYEFYRRYLKITALKPVQRMEPTPLTGFDFYVLVWGDVERGKQANLKPIYNDPDEYGELTYAVEQKTGARTTSDR